MDFSKNCKYAKKYRRNRGLSWDIQCTLWIEKTIRL